MPPQKESSKGVADHINEALMSVASAMTADDAVDPQIQQILQTLQQGMVQVVHALNQAKAQKMAGTGGQQGQTMSAGPGQQGYGQPSPSPAQMAMAGAGGAPGGSPDEMSRVVGAAGKGMVQ